MTATWCRQCEAACGLLVEVRDGQVVSVDGDPDHPASLGFLCPAARAWAEERGGPRITAPLRRAGAELHPVAWAEAIEGAGRALGEIRRRHGPGSVGVLVGRGASQLDAVRALAVSMSLGAPGLYTPLARWAGPILYATGRVLGYPAALLSDVGRADVVVLLGGDQPLGSWGPVQAGTSWLVELARARERGARVVIAGTRRGGLDAEELPVRPGTSTWLLLGLGHALLDAGLEDRQFLRDQCTGEAEVRAALAPYTPARVARICGVEPEALRTLALRLARAPRATVVRDRGLMLEPHAAVGAWALLVVHALTANLLRPGGLYESRGLVDLRHVLSRASPAGARSSSGTRPLMAQLPEGAMVDALRDGTLRALVTVGADPPRHLPGSAAVTAALESLELLVCLDAVPRQLHDCAHWILPVPHALERQDLHLLDSALFPGRFSQHTPAVVPPPEGAVEARDALAELIRAARPPLRRGTAWLPWRLVARGLSSVPLEPWVERMWRTATGVPMWQLREATHGLHLGESDRSTWRPTGGRLRLAPPELIAAARDLPDPEDPPGRPLWLGVRASAAWHGPRLEVHPDAAAALGVADGDEVVVVGPAGEATVRLALDPALRPDAAVIPGAWGRGPHPEATAGPLADIVSVDRRDALTGAPSVVGTRIGLRPAGR